MNSKLEELVDRVRPALAGHPGLGGSVLVNLGSAGAVFVGADNTIQDATTVNALTAHAPINATITTTLDTIANLQAGGSVVWALIDGDIQITGDRDLAERFGKLLQTANT